MDIKAQSKVSISSQPDQDGTPFSEIKRLLSPQDVTELQRQLGGMSIYIAGEARSDSALAQVLGINIAQLLSRHFHGEWVWIPSGRMELRRASARDRAALIVELNKRGLMKRDIARRALCSERWVYKVLSEVDLKSSIFTHKTERA